MSLLFKSQKKIFLELNNLIKRHPAMAVFVCHEYFRNLCPYDPYIKFKHSNPVKRIIETQKKILDLFKVLKKFENYKILFNNDQFVKKFHNFSEQNKDIYFKKNFQFNEVKKNLLKRFKSVKFDLKKGIKNKIVLDAGCGPGRFTYILSSFKPKKIYGVDLLKDNIQIAKRVFKNKDVKYYQGNVLKLPHKNNTFDFVYSSGVVHHTQNMKKGIDELFRVCKDGGYIYLYAYGRGGLYWAARKTMNKLMKKIPQHFTQSFLNMMGMPSNRLFFLDNWYVSHEDHTYTKDLIKILKKYKPKKIQKVVSGVKYDYQTGIEKYKKLGKLIWGDGDLRYLIKK